MITLNEDQKGRRCKLIYNLREGWTEGGRKRRRDGRRERDKEVISRIIKIPPKNTSQN